MTKRTMPAAASAFGKGSKAGLVEKLVWNKGMVTKTGLGMVKSKVLDCKVVSNGPQYHTSKAI